MSRLAAALCAVFALIAPAVAQTTKPAWTGPTLYVAGDSTANSNGNLRGWGSELQAFFDPAKMKVVNRAIGARSSRTFFTEGRWDAILKDLKPGDVVLVQFGHNDAGNFKDPKAKGRPSIQGDDDHTEDALNADGVKHEQIHTFGWYMRYYARTAKEKGATVVLLTKVPHKDWQDGKIKREGDRKTFIPWTQDAAKTEGVLYADINEVMSLGFEKLGPAGVDPLFGDPRTHFNVEGAKYAAAAVTAGLKGLPGNPLAKYFSDAADKLPDSLVVPTSDH